MVDNEKGIIGRQYLFNFLSTTKPKEGKMKKVFMLSVFAIVIAITIGFTSTDANAEDVEYQVIDYLVRVDFIPVPDVDKHAVGTYERRGVAIYKDGQTAAYHSKGTWDFIDSNGPFTGYATLTYKDGSTAMTRYSGNMTKEPEKLPRYTGKGEYIKGTGRYEGIKGTVSFTGEYITPYGKETKGDSIVINKASYTLPK
jgi:hypothetical protein